MDPRGGWPTPGALWGQQSGPAGEALLSRCVREATTFCLWSHFLRNMLSLSWDQGRKEGGRLLQPRLLQSTLPYETRLCRSSGAVALSWMSCVGWAPPHLAESVRSILHLCARTHAEHLHGWICPLDGDWLDMWVVNDWMTICHVRPHFCPHAPFLTFKQAAGSVECGWGKQEKHTRFPGFL